MNGFNLVQNTRKSTFIGLIIIDILLFVAPVFLIIFATINQQITATSRLYAYMLAFAIIVYLVCSIYSSLFTRGIKDCNPYIASKADAEKWLTTYKKPIYTNLFAMIITGIIAVAILIIGIINGTFVTQIVAGMTSADFALFWMSFFLSIILLSFTVIVSINSMKPFIMYKDFLKEKDTEEFKEYVKRLENIN